MDLPVSSERSVALIQVSHKYRGCPSTALAGISKLSTVLALHGSFIKNNCLKGEKLLGFSALDTLPASPPQKKKSVHGVF